MKLQRLGTTDLQVSPLGLGTVQLGMPYGIGLLPPPSDIDCARLLNHALETGINYFDTAPDYGRSEEVVGKAFAHTNPKPIIATKLALRKPPLRGEALRQHIEESVARSLKHLGLETLDLLQIHNSEGSLLVPELLENMDNLSSKGIVRHWGATTYWESDALDTLAIPGRIRTLQVAYSLLDQRLEKRLFPHCKKQKTAVILRSIFLKGALSHRAGNLPPELSDLRQESQKAGRIADAAGIRLPALALRFVAFNPHVQITLFGTTSIAETKANTAAFQEGPLPLDVIEQLNHLRVDDEQMLKPVYLTPGWA